MGNCERSNEEFNHGGLMLARKPKKGKTASNYTLQAWRGNSQLDLNNDEQMALTILKILSKQ
jgi:hypothetical protein